MFAFVCEYRCVWGVRECVSVGVRVCEYRCVRKCV